MVTAALKVLVALTVVVSADESPVGVLPLTVRLPLVLKFPVTLAPLAVTAK